VVGEDSPLAGVAVALFVLGDPRDRFAPGRRARRERSPSWRRATATVLIVVSGAVLVAGFGIWWVRRDLVGNITTVALDHPVEPKAHEKSIWDQYPNGRNLLLLGSDTRQGVDGRYGSASRLEGARSDTAILVHISGDGKWISGISIPRDTVMELPLTKKVCGRQAYDHANRFNEAFQAGGPACTVAAAERLTGLRVDNVLAVDFEGFKKLVDALGGVRVCLNHPVHDTDSLLDLPGGRQKLGGEAALSLMRARHSLGNGSDIGRTARQQYLITQTAQQVRSGGVLRNPAKLYRVATAATRALTADEGLASVDSLMDLAEQVSGVAPSRIHLTTVPWLPDPNDPENTVVVDEAKARPLLRAMKDDTEPGAPRGGRTTGSTTPTDPSSPTTTTTTKAATPITTTTDPSVKDVFCEA
jgi:LCP family protein required for cell wall assembly